MVTTAGLAGVMRSPSGRVGKMVSAGWRYEGHGDSYHAEMVGMEAGAAVAWCIARGRGVGGVRWCVCGLWR